MVIEWDYNGEFIFGGFLSHGGNPKLFMVMEDHDLL
jgi:hypothetical protein